MVATTVAGKLVIRVNMPAISPIEISDTEIGVVGAAVTTRDISVGILKA